MASKRLFLVGVLAVLSLGTRMASPSTRAVRPPLFVQSPADPSQVAAIVPRGNINPGGGHIRPVKHMYLDYVTPRNGGVDSVDVRAMALGRVALAYHRQTPACLMPVGDTRRECADTPGATALIDEYGVWIQHTDQITSYYDHLHSLDPELGIPDWRAADEGWVTFGGQQVLFPGLNGAGPPSRLRPGQRLGATRNYFTSWDLGVVDTRVIAAFLGSGRLRYPSLGDLVRAFVSEGGSASIPDVDRPFPGEMFVNSGCFLDDMTPGLAAVWLPKLGGDGSCGRPDWDLAGTLQGNWFRADVVEETLANMAGIEGNAISFSPYNRDPSNFVQIAIGNRYFSSLPATADPLELGVRAALARGLLIAPDRSPGAVRDPDPGSVGVGGYACYDVPDGPALHSLLVYHQDIGGEGHVRLLHRTEDCGELLLKVTPANLPGEPWTGDYVR